MKDQILAFLVDGHSKEGILRITGCSSDMYDEFLKDSGFQAAITEGKRKNREQRITDHYAALEETALADISRKIKSEDLEIPQLCRVLDTLARNRAIHQKPAQTLQTPTTHIQVTVAVPQPERNSLVILDSNNQVVAIGDKTMAALPLAGVQELFKAMEQRNNIDNVKELRNDLLEISDSHSESAEASLV